jgi:ribonuclease HII
MRDELWVHEARAISRGHRRIAGVDEAGRGPLAGPVVAAAVILPRDRPDLDLDDSKRLTPRRRRLAYDAIYQGAVAVGIGIVDALEIDRLNILNASFQAMAMAVANLVPAPDLVLVDGPFSIPPLAAAQAPIVGGDARSASIAAASIVAKVTRDRLMARYDLDYPQFGFAAHKGYPTRAHRSAIERHGPCPIHRLSFRGSRPDPPGPR